MANSTKSMIFSPSTETSLKAAAEFINTTYREPDVLDIGDAALEMIARSWHVAEFDPCDLSELRRLREVRAYLDGLWRSDEQTLVTRTNQILSETTLRLQLVRRGSDTYELCARSSDQSLASQIVVAGTLAVVEAIQTGQTWRFQACLSDTCRNVFVDLSRNHSRRFCDHGCGNRVHVAAYRKRQRPPTPTGGLPDT
ncbi:conserved hypothetical protein [Nostocoides japonicum T1-X7]|uniref:Zinc finger CGNR domain-containing protein n=1 Tax=Nostocoides japonicum T1-X7 TaxID=1194083 RepID=A0A077M4W7_9MICO|nr:CGNR zinc finger domain-containing protein [Tetrasphaera japonica]CCH79144.1 conserved hypothetical protein [Tetrasphaera japonica T1-X7]